MIHIYGQEDSVLPRCQFFSAFNRTNTISIKIPARYFEDIDKPVIKFIWKDKKPKIANTILKKNKVREVKLQDFKAHYEALVIKTV